MAFQQNTRTDAFDAIVAEAAKKGMLGSNYTVQRKPTVSRKTCMLLCFTILMSGFMTLSLFMPDRKTAPEAPQQFGTPIGTATQEAGPGTAQASTQAFQNTPNYESYQNPYPNTAPAAYYNASPTAYPTTAAHHHTFATPAPGTYATAPTASTLGYAPQPGTPEYYHYLKMQQMSTRLKVVIDR